MPERTKYVTCKELELTVEPIKESIEEIKNNHLPHIQHELEKINTRFQAFDKRFWIIIIALIVLSFAVGIDVAKILLGGI